MNNPESIAGVVSSQESHSANEWRIVFAGDKDTLVQLIDPDPIGIPTNPNISVGSYFGYYKTLDVGTGEVVCDEIDQYRQTSPHDAVVTTDPQMIEVLYENDYCFGKGFEPPIILISASAVKDVKAIGKPNLYAIDTIGKEPDQLKAELREAIKKGKRFSEEVDNSVTILMVEKPEDYSEYPGEVQIYKPTEAGYNEVKKQLERAGQHSESEEFLVGAVIVDAPGHWQQRLLFKMEGEFPHIPAAYTGEDHLAELDEFRYVRILRGEAVSCGLKGIVEACFNHDKEKPAAKTQDKPTEISFTREEARGKKYSGHTSLDKVMYEVLKENLSLLHDKIGDPELNMIVGDFFAAAVTEFEYDGTTYSCDLQIPNHRIIIKDKSIWAELAASRQALSLREILKTAPKTQRELDEARRLLSPLKTIGEVIKTNPVTNEPFSEEEQGDLKNIRVHLERYILREHNEVESEAPKEAKPKSYSGFQSIAYAVREVAKQHFGEQGMKNGYIIVCRVLGIDYKGRRYRPKKDLKTPPFKLVKQIKTEIGSGGNEEKHESLVAEAVNLGYNEHTPLSYLFIQNPETGENITPAEQSNLRVQLEICPKDTKTKDVVEETELERHQVYDLMEGASEQTADDNTRESRVEEEQTAADDTRETQAEGEQTAANDTRETDIKSELVAVFEGFGLDK
jgi:hypothetical protein